MFDEAEIEALRLIPRRRGFRADPEPIFSSISLRGFRFPEELFGKKTSLRRGFDVDGLIVEIEARARRRGFEDERVLIPRKIPAVRGFKVS